jgi:hypothetical protein
MAFSAKLTDATQAQFVWSVVFPRIEKHLKANGELFLKIEKPKKSREQEEMYHAMIGEIAKRAMHQGAKWDAESWKRLLIDKFCREIGLNTGMIIGNLDNNGIVQLGFQTRRFTVEQGSMFIEFLYAWAANAGIDL